MKIVRIKARNLRSGDVIGNQRIHSGCIHHHTGRDESHRSDAPRTYVILRKPCGSGLEMKYFNDEEFVKVKRPRYNRKKRRLIKGA